MRTITLKTNQHRLIANLRHAFTPRSMLGELLQNARRAKAKRIDVTVDGDTLTVSDNGCGIADLQTLIFIAESGWDEHVKSRENAFGLGVLSTLYFAKTLRVHSGEQAFEAETAAIINGDSITVQSKPPRTGTEVRLTGVASPDPVKRLRVWVEKELERLCLAFPVPVFYNGVEVPRPFADKTLPWRKTRMGKVLINLKASPSKWCAFLQGLPIGDTDSCNYRGWHQTVLLPDGTLAKLPDRQHLLNAEQDNKRIQAAVNMAYREALMEAKAGLSPEAFITRHARNCLDSRNADLLNDVPFAPLDWFRDWGDEPAGFRHDWNRCYRDGLVSREKAETRGVWRMTESDDERDTFAVQVYLQAAQAFVLEEERLDFGHWLYDAARAVEPPRIQVRHGAIRHRSRAVGLEDDVELVLVDSLYVEMDGLLEYATNAIRHQGIIYLTMQADAPTQLVSDYIFNDDYDESAEDADAERIRTFIAIACEGSPAKVVEALLPDSLRYAAQSKLANAQIKLTFDAEGKLISVD